MKTREKIIKFRLSDDEADELQSHAQHCGLTQSQFLRMLIRGNQPKPLPPEALWELLNALYEIHGSLQDGDVRQEFESAILRFQAAFTLPGKAVLRGTPQSPLCGEKEQPRSGEPFDACGKSDERRAL